MDEIKENEQEWLEIDGDSLKAVINKPKEDKEAA